MRRSRHPTRRGTGRMTARGWVARTRTLALKVRAAGWGGVLHRALRGVVERVGTGGDDLPIRESDIADSARMNGAPEPHRLPATEPMVIGWVTAPPGPGSGGHTTMF